MRTLLCNNHLHAREASLGSLGLVFTAGIGEHSCEIRGAFAPVAVG
jgi:hypothetical protein